MIRKDVNVRRRPDDTLEMDTEIMDALQSYEVGFHLMPLPKAKVAEAKPQQPSTLDSQVSHGIGSRVQVSLFTRQRKGQRKRKGEKGCKHLACRVAEQRMCWNGRSQSQAVLQFQSQ